MASIRRHPNAPTRWQVRYRDPTGRQRTKSFARKADAEKWAVMIEAGKLQGDWLDPHLGKTTVREWSERWFATTVHLKPKTRAGYESLLRLHVLPAFGALPLNRIQPLDVRQWVAKLSNGFDTIVGYHPIGLCCFQESRMNLGFTDTPSISSTTGFISQFVENRIAFSRPSIYKPIYQRLEFLV